MNGNEPAIVWGGFALAYLLLLPPLAAILWLRLPLVKPLLVAVARMSLQLLFVGFYLQIVFRLDHAGLTLLWLAVMLVVADLSILHGCGLRVRLLGGPLLLALALGTLLPLGFLLAGVLGRSPLLGARYAIPLGGMILGNCLRADIIGIRRFFDGLRERERNYLQDLADGATPAEATRPYLRQAFNAALAPTLATMATIGLVSLPGMMTGVILGGADPLTAIVYQIVIMLAIYCGAAITVLTAIRFSMRRAFLPTGLVDPALFAPRRTKGRKAKP